MIAKLGGQWEQPEIIMADIDFGSGQKNQKGDALNKESLSARGFRAGKH